MAVTKFRMDPQTSRKVGLFGIGLFVVYVALAFSGRTISLPVSRFFHGILENFFDMFFGVFKNYEMAYVLVPIYINWLATDYFQERRGTSLGNAATNGFMGLWVGIDWIRKAQQLYLRKPDMGLLVGKVVFAIFLLVFGFVVIYEAMHGKRIAHYIGRVREISYFAIIMTSIVYGAVRLSSTAILAAILMFPVFYGVVEFIEFYVLPAPGTETPLAKET